MQTMALTVFALGRSLRSAGRWVIEVKMIGRAAWLALKRIEGQIGPTSFQASPENIHVFYGEMGTKSTRKNGELSQMKAKKIMNTYQSQSVAAEIK